MLILYSSHDYVCVCVYLQLRYSAVRIAVIYLSFFRDMMRNTKVLQFFFKKQFYLGLQQSVKVFFYVLIYISPSTTEAYEWGFFA